MSELPFYNPLRGDDESPKNLPGEIEVSELDNSELPSLEVSDQAVINSALIGTLFSTGSLIESFILKSGNEIDPKGFALAALVFGVLSIPAWAVSEHLERKKIKEMAGL